MSVMAPFSMERRDDRSAPPWPPGEALATKWNHDTERWTIDVRGLFQYLQNASEMMTFIFVIGGFLVWFLFYIVGCIALAVLGNDVCNFRPFPTWDVG